MKSSLDSTLRENQAGFRANRSCNDHITTLRIIIEQSREFNSKLYATFVDFEKAFDSINRSALWKLLYKYGFPQKYINLMKQLYNGHTVRILHNRDLSLPIDIQSGVR